MRIHANLNERTARRSFAEPRHRRRPLIVIDHTLPAFGLGIGSGDARTFFVRVKRRPGAVNVTLGTAGELTAAEARAMALAEIEAARAERATGPHFGRARLVQFDPVRRKETTHAIPISDDKATGTIDNSDPIPRAWLARFGRTVAGHVTDAIAERLAGPADGGSHVTLGGQRLSLDGNAPDVPGEAGPEAADGLTAFADRIAAHADGGARQRRVPGAARALTGRELLLGSAFRLALGGDNADSAGTSWTAWGRAAQSRFDGGADGLALDGDVTTFTLGANAMWSRWLAGVAMAHSTGDGGYREHAARDGHPDRGSGTLESTLTGVHP